MVDGVVEVLDFQRECRVYGVVDCLKGKNTLRDDTYLYLNRFAIHKFWFGSPALGIAMTMVLAG